MDIIDSTFDTTQGEGGGSFGVSQKRERRQTVNLVTTRELECGEGAGLAGVVLVVGDNGGNV